MSDIEKAVQAAIEEFCEEAYMRFEISTFLNEATPPDRFWFIPSRATFNKVLNDNGRPRHVRLKSLPDLFSHDVAVYGDNAYLMWSGSVTYDDAFGHFYEVNGVIFDNNAHVLSEFEVSTLDRVCRKTSAALPFDIERAKAGDIFEYFDGFDWVTPENEIKKSLLSIFESSPNRKDFRMKYPKKEES